MAHVSVSMIVKNEALRLRQALTSLQALEQIDEVVVLDTGSTDATMDIARDMGARVFEQPWQDDFSFHRNHCLSLCKNDWVFIIDGDEVLEDPGDLDAFLAHPTGDGALVRIQTEAGGTRCEAFLSIRAFNRQHARWRHPIHNQLVGIKNPRGTSAMMTAHYEPSDHQAQRRRLKVLLGALEAEPTCSHHLYFVAKTYRSLSEWEAAMHYIDRCLATDGADAHPILYAWRVEANLELGRQDAAVDCLIEGLRRHPTLPDLCFYDFLFAAKRWYEVSASPPVSYLLAPSISTHHAARFPEMAKALGLPVEFADAEPNEETAS